MKLDLVVTGVGILSPVGLTGLVTLHSIRSGISRLTLQPFPDRVREWIVGSDIPTWSPAIREERLAALALSAIDAALERAGAPMHDAAARATTAIILGAPENGRPGYQFPPRDHPTSMTVRQSGLESMAAIEVIPAGACSAQTGLGRAASLLATSRIHRCVIGAVDTQLQLRTIRWHEQNFRLKCSYVSDGLMPAEAACFIVVEPEASARARGARVIARILAVNAFREDATILSDRPNAALGLTKATRATLADAGVQPSDVGMVWSDLNGESYRAREWAFTEVRLGFTTATELMHPADCHGDLGAATDASLLGLAALCHGTGWSEGKPLLVFSGSDGGVRAATLLVPGEAAGPFLQVSKGLPRVFSASFAVPTLPEPAQDFRRTEDPARAYFEWQLREEHRDELASLHYQRKAILTDETIAWRRLQEPEQRMLNHLDAAVVNGPTSMAVVASGVRADEEGLCFAGSFLLGTLPNADNLAHIAAACEDPAAPRLAGVAAGLIHAPVNEALDRFVADLVDRGEPAVRALAIHVAARRRIDIRSHLTRPEFADALLAKAVADAAWRLRAEEAVPTLQGFLSHERSDIRRAAILALLCLTPARTAAFARSRIAANAEFDGALATCLGIAGQLADAALLIRQIEVDPSDMTGVAALGILGAPESVPYLIRQLQSEREDMKVAAAGALDLMSGHHARERVMQTPPPDIAGGSEPDELREVERVSTSVEHWSTWWYAQRGRLDQSTRWRRGGYFTLGACIDELADPRSALIDRTRAYVELSARAGTNIPFEPDWFVARQDDAIEAWRRWWDSSRPN